MKLLGFLFILVGVGLLILVVGGELSREAVGMALGVVFGALTSVPVWLVAARRADPETRIVYQDRIVYRVAEPVEPQPQRATTTALAADDDGYDWLRQSLDIEAQAALGIQRPARRRIGANSPSGRGDVVVSEVRP